MQTAILNCTQLTYLNISYCVIKDSLWLKALRHSAGTLRHFVARDAHDLPEQAIVELVQMCPQLSELRYTVTGVGESISVVRDHCTSLLSLELCSLKKASACPQELLALTAKPLPQLRTLRLLNLPCNDDFVRALAPCVPRLEDLYITSAHELSDVALMTLGRHCKWITRLTLYYAPITNLGLSVLFQEGVYLQELYLLQTRCSAEVARNYAAPKAKITVVRLSS